MASIVRAGSFFGIEADANADRDEGAKRAMNPSAQFDPLFARFGLGGREREQEQQRRCKQF